MQVTSVPVQVGDVDDWILTHRGGSAVYYSSDNTLTPSTAQGSLSAGDKVQLFGVNYFITADASQQAEVSYSDALPSGMSGLKKVGGLRLGSLVAAIGDSETIGVSGAQTSWFSQMIWLSGQRMQFYANAAVGGQSSTQIAARFKTDIVDLIPKPDHVFLMCGTNDGPTAQNLSLATTRKNINNMCAQAAAAGIPMSIVSAPPRTVGATQATKTHINRVNRIKRSLALFWGNRFIDVFKDLVDPLTGLYKASMSSDGLHPTPVGARVAGASALAQVLNALPTWSPGFAESATDDDNLLTDGLFTVDTNADGVPDTWSAAFAPVGGTATHSLDTDAANYLGNGMACAQAGNNSIRSMDKSFNNATGIGFTTGDRLAYLGKVKLDCETGPMTAGGGNIIRLRQTINAVPTDILIPLSAHVSDLSSGSAFYGEVVLQTNTQLTSTIIAAQGTGKITVSQLTLLNLTRLAAASVV